MMQITKAVTYLHSKEIIHGTLSTKQIVFIQSQEKCLTKIAYFPLDGNIFENNMNTVNKCIV